MFRIERYSPAYRNLWDNFVRESKNATFLFERSFMEYHSERFTDYSTLIWKDDELISIFPANKSDTSIWSHQGLSYGGLVVKKDMDLPLVLSCFELFTKFYKENGFNEVIYKSLPSIYCIEPSHEEEYALFRLRAERVRVEVNSIIDFGIPIEYAKDRKRMINIAQKNHLRIEQEKDTEAFWSQILVPTRWETHRVIPAHTNEEIELLMGLFPENIKHFNVYNGDELIGGGTIFFTNKVVHTQYIASNSVGKKLGASDFLIDYLIQNFKSTYRFLSFGISTDHQGQRLNEGLLYWKNGFGATILPHYTYRIPL